MNERAAAIWSSAAPSSGSEGWLRRTGPTLLFLAVCVFLSAVENVRYPTGTPLLYFAVPGVDLAVVFGAYALLGRHGKRVPAPLHAALVVTFLLVRCFRLGDGVTGRFLRRGFHLHLDFILIPELVRLLEKTASLSLIVGGGFLLLAGLGVVTYGTHRALRYAEGYLADATHARGYWCALAALVALSLVVASGGRRDPLYSGVFAKSGALRLADEVAIAWQVPKIRGEMAGRIASVQRAVEAGPNDLSRLERADVVLFFVESYGETAFRSASKAERMKPAYQAFERELGASDFGVVSSVLESPTAGGGSWLAHATFASGVKVGDQLAYDMLLLARPPTLSDFFQRAGYRSVLVQPGTTRVHVEGELLNFDQRYYAPNFDYHGPEIGWGRFPDQYVIDFVQRRESERRDQPLFMLFVLVTSHVPWSAGPPVIDDWSRIGNGAIYRELAVTRYRSGWTNTAQMADAYTATIIYDLEVIRRYVAEFVRDDALVIVLGDHQPVGEITEDPSRLGVPIHVLSRRRDLLEPFGARGYVEGMLPERQPPYEGMDGFLRAFLQDFSRGRSTDSDRQNRKSGSREASGRFGD